MGEEELTEAADDASSKAEILKPEIGPKEVGEGTALNSRTRHLIQRSFIYGLLLILVVITVTRCSSRIFWKVPASWSAWQCVRITWVILRLEIPLSRR